MTQTRPFTVTAARALHKRIPIEHHVKTAFGTMTERHAVFLQVTAADGTVGTGESWINFPHWAAWERVAAYEQVLIPYLEGKKCVGIPAFIRTMYNAFKGPALQSGTVGPLLQALCGVELALWEIAAKIAGVPVCNLWFDAPRKDITVYASGINAPLPFDLIDEHLNKGVTLFKLKLGFGDAEDTKNLNALKGHLDGRADMAVDANRGWTFNEAAGWLERLAGYGIEWLEEPLCPEDLHRTAELRALGNVRIAGGENTITVPGCTVGNMAELDVDIVQPDLTKYNPPHLCLAVIDDAVKSGRMPVPHFLGSAMGQAASLHLAAGCPDALVELDINRNPLRTELCTEPFTVTDGKIRIPDVPGWGWRLK